jgi:formylglycine-generating enzyme required for sulfatase activity
MKVNPETFAFYFLLLASNPFPSSGQAQQHSGKQYEQKIPGTDVSFQVVYIPDGVFSMGSPTTESGRGQDEGPLHPITIDSLWVGKVEVTWDLFGLFLNENKSLFSDLAESRKKGIDAISRPTPPFEDPSMGMGRRGFPVVNVSPYAALSFCKWLSVITGKFYRLPTEAEWEYICRAGTQTAYHFGTDPQLLGEYAVYYENSNGQYAKGATKKPNPWGVYDMHGNVAEWTLDQYAADYYVQFEGRASHSPWNKPTSLYPRVYRGGSWDDDARNLRSASRMKSGIALQRNDPQIPKSFWWFTNASFIGFRLVSPAKSPTDEELKKFWSMVLDE